MRSAPSTEGLAVGADHRRALRGHRRSGRAGRAPTPRRHDVRRGERRTRRALAAGVDARCVRDRELRAQRQSASARSRGATACAGTRPTTTPGASGRREPARSTVTLRLHRRHARQRDGVDASRLRAVQRHQPLPLSRGALDGLRVDRGGEDRAGVPDRHRDVTRDGAADLPRGELSRARRHALLRRAVRPRQRDRVGEDGAVRDVSARARSPVRRAPRRGSRSSASIPPEVLVFGEAPWDSYDVMWITDSVGGGMSGLEHANSHVDVSIPPGIGSEFQPRLFAHEIFHSWNVKRLRPADLVPYRYDRSQPTPWLWVSEGITDYYGDLAMVRGGVVDAAGLLRAHVGEDQRHRAGASVLGRGRVAQRVDQGPRRHRLRCTTTRDRSPASCSTS